MKRIAAILLVVLGAAAGFARWLDLVNFTDPVTEFVQAGSVWLRYGVVAALLVAAAAAALLVPRGASLGARRAPGLGAVAFLTGAAFAALAAGQLLEGSPALLPMGLLSLCTAWWLVTLALNWLERAESRPASGVYGGIVGTVLFYLLTLQRFARNSSSYHRVGPLLGLLAALLALVFGSALLRAVQRPRCGNGRKLVFSGFGCFYLCTCLQLPQAVYGRMTGATAFGTFAIDLALAALGVLGAAVAFYGIANAQPVAQGPETAEMVEKSMSKCTKSFRQSRRLC